MRTRLSAGIALLLLVSFAFFPAFAGEGDSEIEPNDTRELADYIDGFIIEGNLDEEDEHDWYVLEGQEGVFPTITIYFDDEEVEVDFEVYSDDELVETAIAYGTNDSIQVEVPGECFIHAYLWSGEGDYTIEIEPKETDPTDSECEGEDEIEPNDDRELANLIEGLRIEGYACENEDDWFVLDGSEGIEPTFILVYDDDEYDIDMEVFSDEDHAGSLLGTDSPDTETFEVPGECFIRVYSWDGEGEYVIEIEP